MGVHSATQLVEAPLTKAAISKASRRLMPMLVSLYIVAFMDRTNVGFAEAALETDKGVGAGAFALGAGIFFIGYAIFEVPSNLMLRRIGAKVWLARIAITWGIVAACFAFVQGPASFVTLRFLLGVTEAGLFPGVIMYLAEWFPNKSRVRLFAIFYLAQPLSQVIGSPLSGGLLSLGESIPGVAGWQVMFGVQGVLAILAGVACLFFLVDGPAKATFLSAEEKASLKSVMDAEEKAKHDTGPKGVGAALINGRVWYFTVIYFCLQVAVYGVTFYMPQQVSQLTGQKVGLSVGLLSALPWIVGLFACYYIGRIADTVTRRRNLGIVLFVLTGLCLFGSAWAGVHGQPIIGIVFICLAVGSFLAVGPVTWAYPTAFLSGAAAATGIGLINSLGNLGGFVAPILRTEVNHVFDSATNSAGVYALGILPFLAAAMMYGTRRFKLKADEMLDD